MAKDKQLVFKLYEHEHEHEHEQIQEYAKGQGKTITGFIMDLIREEMESIEDEKDVRAVLNSNEPSISWAELRKELTSLYGLIGLSGSLSFVLTSSVFAFSYLQR